MCAKEFSVVDLVMLRKRGLRRKHMAQRKALPFRLQGDVIAGDDVLRFYF